MNDGGLNAVQFVQSGSGHMAVNGKDVSVVVNSGKRFASVVPQTLAISRIVIAVTVAIIKRLIMGLMSRRRHIPNRVAIVVDSVLKAVLIRHFGYLEARLEMTIGGALLYGYRLAKNACTHL